LHTVKGLQIRHLKGYKQMNRREAAIDLWQGTLPPNAMKMHMTITFPLVHVQQKLSGGDFPGLSIVTLIVGPCP
jgi:hypothetical protein